MSPRWAPDTRRARLGWLLIGLALVAAVVIAVLTRPGPRHTGALDPQNPGPDGAQALARVLEQQGVEVDVARSADDLDEASTTDATLVVTAPDRLGRSSYERLVEHAGDRPIVYLAPAGSAELLGLGAPTTSAAADLAIPADCVDGAERPPRLGGLRLADDYLVLYPLDQAEGGTGCFLGDASGHFDGAEVQQAATSVPGREGPLPRAALVALPSGDLAFGAPRALSNARITDADNAAIGLRLLGGSSRVVWYVPDPVDALPSDAAAGAAAQLPDWLAPGVWLLAMVGVAVVVWRGRRLGPMVTERLPVRVRAIETTLSRGRLYLRTRDADHAATELRRATRTRAVRRLRLPRGAPDRAVVDAVAARTGLPPAEVARLLLDDSPVTGDHALGDLAARLRTLDEHLRKADP